MELMYSFYEKGRTQYFQAMKVEGRTLFETNPQMAKNWTESCCGKFLNFEGIFRLQYIKENFLEN